MANDENPSEEPISRAPVFVRALDVQRDARLRGGQEETTPEELERLGRSGLGVEGWSPGY